MATNPLNTHKPYIFLMVMIKCIDKHIRQVQCTHTQVTVKARGPLVFIVDSTVNIYFVQYSTESYYYSLKSK